MISDRVRPNSIYNYINFYIFSFTNDCQLPAEGTVLALRIIYTILSMLSVLMMVSLVIVADAVCVLCIPFRLPSVLQRCQLPVSASLRLGKELTLTTLPLHPPPGLNRWLLPVGLTIPSLLTTRWNDSEICNSVSQSFSVIKLQPPTEITSLIVYPLLAIFFSLSHFPHPLLVFPK